MSPNAHSTHPSSGPKEIVKFRSSKGFRPSKRKVCLSDSYKNSLSGIEGEGGLIGEITCHSVTRSESDSMVRLITHNLLACHAKGCTTNNFPLQFVDIQVEIREAELNSEFLKGFMPKIEWKALVDGARQVSC